MHLIPGDTFEVIFRDGGGDEHAVVFVMADAPNRPDVWYFSHGDVMPTAAEDAAMRELTADQLSGGKVVLCMTVAAATALIERARGGGSAEDDEP